MSPENHQERFDKAVHKVYAVYPSLTPEETYLTSHWPQIKEHLPLIFELKESISYGSVKPNREFAIILCNATWLLFEQNRLEDVAALLPDLKDILFNTLEAGDEFMNAQFWRLCLKIHISNQEYAAAQEDAIKMLDVLKSMKLEDKFLLADAYNAIGFCQLGFEECDNAYQHLERSLQIREKDKTRNSGMRGITLANIALYYNLGGNYSLALENAEDGLGLVAKQYGLDSFKAAEVHSQIGNAYIGLEELDEALVSHQKTLKIREDTLHDGSKVAASPHKVAWIYSQQGDSSKAEPLL
ncbi:hypothetical protein CC86DRAFT_66105 [Ophiobolus disseminans]|uniref:Uncharacterized protein n=1 Tax=Ophiobolus disseminans TaxID=1469910 RepID=A0A6A6ZRC7_9PLEO|nr:hypothetical protein CC86DRAFT_66105 [Ophiobolus disseminans]